MVMNDQCLSFADLCLSLAKSNPEGHSRGRILRKLLLQDRSRSHSDHRDRHRLLCQSCWFAYLALRIVQRSCERAPALACLEISWSLAFAKPFWFLLQFPSSIPLLLSRNRPFLFLIICAPVFQIQGRARKCPGQPDAPVRVAGY